MFAPMVEEQRAAREAQHSQFTQSFALQEKVAAADIERGKAETAKAKTSMWMAILEKPGLAHMHEKAEKELMKLIGEEPEPAAAE